MGGAPLRPWAWPAPLLLEPRGAQMGATQESWLCRGSGSCEPLLKCVQPGWGPRLWLSVLEEPLHPVVVRPGEAVPARPRVPTVCPPPRPEPPDDRVRGRLVFWAPSCTPSGSSRARDGGWVRRWGL